MEKIIGRSLGGNGTAYFTQAGPFYIWPYSKGGWLAIWEPQTKQRHFNDMVARFDNRRAAIGWIENALASI